MNFEFSEELQALKREMRRVLEERGSVAGAKRVLDGAADRDDALWRTAIELGWTGAGLPERFGGSGLGPEALCVLADELGYGLVATPFTPSIVIVADAILSFGSEEQRQRWLPRLVAGETVATFAFGDPAKDVACFEYRNDRLTGTHGATPGGGGADLCLVVARHRGGRDLYLADLNDGTVTREPTVNADPSQPRCRLHLAGTQAERLPGDNAKGEPVRQILDRAAIYTAFEQIGGAQACLDRAVAYAKERYAFGRPIGSFQAIKHRLADIHAAIELARSNAYYAAWALGHAAPELPRAAAAARLAASEAYQDAARENIQVHGGMGFTWESDCHLFYRRAQILALEFGGPSYWADTLIDRLTANV